MRRAATILSSRLARGVLLLALLIWPWAFVGRVYSAAVGAFAGGMLVTEGSPVTLTFKPDTETAGAAGAWKLRVLAEDATTGRFIETALDLRRAGYLQSAVFVALALSMRASRSRRLGILGAGLALLQILPLLPILFFFSGKLPVQAFHLGSVTRSCIEIGYHALVAPPGMAYAVPALLWLVLCWLFNPDGLRLDSLWVPVSPTKGSGRVPRRARA